MGERTFSKFIMGFIIQELHLKRPELQSQRSMSEKDPGWQGREMMETQTPSTGDGEQAAHGAAQLRQPGKSCVSKQGPTLQFGVGGQSKMAVGVLRKCGLIYTKQGCEWRLAILQKKLEVGVIKRESQCHKVDFSG
jgi:hypothetical protein